MSTSGPRCSRTFVDHFRGEGLGLAQRPADTLALFLEQALADDVVDPVLVDLQRAEFVRHRVFVVARIEIGGRALQHGDVSAFLRHCRDQRCCRCARTDHQHPLAGVIKVLGPGLGMDDAALEALHARPVWRIALGMPVVALAHPQEVGLDDEVLARVLSPARHRPELRLARTMTPSSPHAGSGCEGPDCSPRWRPRDRRGCARAWRSAPPSRA